MPPYGIPTPPNAQKPKITTKIQRANTKLIQLANGKGSTMTTVSATSSTTQTTMPLVSLSSTMSPEAVFAMLQKEITSIDDTLRSMTERIQENNRRTRELNDLKVQLRKLRGQEDPEIDTSKLTDEQIQTLIEIGALPAGTTRTSGMVTLQGLGGDKKARNTKMDQYLQSLDDRISSINSGQDMMMIQFQDLMSRRSNRINMATNLLKKLADASDAIVGNIR